MVQNLERISILDFYTLDQKQNRLTGDIVIESDTFGTIVGFENTRMMKHHDFGTLGHVTFGYGNNDEDKKEGIHYKNLLGTYLHGPILPKNYEITDYLLEKLVNVRGFRYDLKK